MRRLVTLLALLPLACAPKANGTQDPPPASDTRTAAPEATSPSDDARPTEGGEADCISTGGLPPGSVPDSIAQWAELDLAVFEAALPKHPRDPDMATTETSSMKRGQAGHPSPLVMRSFHPPEGDSSLVSITDLQHVCHCSEGMGARLRDAAQGEGDTAEELEGHPVAVKATKDVTDLRVWVADRCEFLIRANSRAEAEELFHATDWAALDETCAERNPAP